MKKLFFLIPLALLLPALSHAQVFPKDAIDTGLLNVPPGTEIQIASSTCYTGHPCTVLAVYGYRYQTDDNLTNNTDNQLTFYCEPYANGFAKTNAALGSQEVLTQFVCNNTLWINDEGGGGDGVLGGMVYVPYDIASTTAPSYTVTPVSVNTSSSGGLATVSLAISTLAGALFFRRA